MDINSWEDTWGKINWTEDSEVIKQKITEFHDAGVDFNMQDEDTIGAFMPLNYAAERSSADVVDLLIKYGADLNRTDNHGWTPLHFAVLCSNVENVQYLINRTSKDFINRQEKNGWTALHMAARYGCAKIVKMLIDAGADINLKTKQGIFTDAKTALELADDKERHKEVRKILQAAEYQPKTIAKHDEKVELDTVKERE